MSMKEDLSQAVLYLEPDGTAKTCGDRCMMHIEKGENKDRCTIHGKDVYVPDVASCGLYVPGPAASPDHDLMTAVTAEESGLVLERVQCKRCGRANLDVSVCIALTKVLQDMGSKDEFQIKPDACCNWFKSKHSGRIFNEIKKRQKEQ